MLKNTPEEHKDHSELGMALKEMQDVANYLNHQMRVNTSMKEFYRIIEEIGGDWDMYKNDRFLEKEGRIRQITQRAGGRRVYYYLFTDLLILALKNHDWISSKRKYVYWCKIELPGCWISPKPDTSGSLLYYYYHQ